LNSKAVSPSPGLLKVPAFVVICAEAKLKLTKAIKSKKFFIIFIILIIVLQI
jgi:hypothetical protein